MMTNQCRCSGSGALPSSTMMFWALSRDERLQLRGRRPFAGLSIVNRSQELLRRFVPSLVEWTPRNDASLPPDIDCVHFWRRNASASPLYSAHVPPHPSPRPTLRNPARGDVSLATTRWDKELRKSDDSVLETRASAQEPNAARRCRMASLPVRDENREHPQRRSAFRTRISIPEERRGRTSTKASAHMTDNAARAYHSTHKHDGQSWKYAAAVECRRSTGKGFPPRAGNRRKARPPRYRLRGCSTGSGFCIPHATLHSFVRKQVFDGTFKTIEPVKEFYFPCSSLTSSFWYP